MGAIGKKPNKRNRNKKVNLNVPEIKKNDQPKERENKKPLKSVKKNNVRNEVKISKAARILAKKIRQSNKNSATKSVAADLLNSNVANVTRTRGNNTNNNEKAGTTLQTKTKKKGVNSKQSNQCRKINEQTLAQTKNHNRSAKSAATDLLNWNVTDVTKTCGNNANNYKKAGTTLQTKNQKKGVKSKQYNQSGKMNEETPAQTKNQNHSAKKIWQRVNNNSKSVAADLLNWNVTDFTKTRGNNANNNKNGRTTLQTKDKKRGVKSKQNSQSGKRNERTRAQSKNQNGNAQKNIAPAKEKSQNIPLTTSQSMKMKKQMNKAKWKHENRVENLKTLSNKKQKQGKPDNCIRSVKVHTESNAVLQGVTKVPRLTFKRLEEMLGSKERSTKKGRYIVLMEFLRERVISKLRATRFRYLNEMLYNNDSATSMRYFKEDPDTFKAYHDGYKQQIEQWRINPLDTIISWIKAMPKHHVIADFGCGEARLASAVSQKVHSIDFVSLNEMVMACDMAHTSLLAGGVDVVVFCLSLMGTNLGDYLMEANRVLKKDGILKIAEVESRFDNVKDFINLLREYGFKNTWTDLSHNLFYFLDFKKEMDIAGRRNKLPPITLKPCLYKRM